MEDPAVAEDLGSYRGLEQILHIGRLARGDVGSVIVPVLVWVQDAGQSAQGGLGDLGKDGGLAAGLVPQDLQVERFEQAAARTAGSAVLLAECHVAEAHGHAARNDARACAAALGEADRAFGQARPGEEPAWLAYFDEAYLAARIGQCFRDLGHGPQAARFARRSLDMNQAYVRGRAFNLALLGAALAQQGQIEEACAAGTRAISIANGLRSRRSIRYVLDLRRRLAPYADQPQVREFSERAARLSAARAAPR